MKEATEFIKLGVMNRKFDEQLSNVHLCKDNIISFNGIVTMSYPCDVHGYNLSVESSKLLRAIAACSYKPNIRITDSNIILTGSGFRAQLPYTDNFTTTEKLTGKQHKIPEGFILSLNKLWPMVSDDASRAWSQSILIKKKMAYVTNNILLARVPLNMKDCVLPLSCVSVLIKAKEDPKSIIITNNAIQFNYKHGGWIQTRVIAESWPKFGKLFKTKGKLKPIPDSFREAVETLRHFNEDDCIVIKDKQVTVGSARVKDIDIPDCSLSLEHTIKMLSVFTSCDFTKSHMLLQGEGINGIMCQRTSI